MPALMEERRPAGVHPSPVVVGPVDAPVAAAVIPAVPPVKAKKKPILLFVFLALVVIASVVGVYEFIYYSHYATTDDAFIEGHVIAISPQIPAKVKSVLIDDNMLVHKGQLMVELDPTDYQIAVVQAKATETAMAGKAKQADAEIDSAKASLDEADAEVAVATANLTNAQADMNRFTELEKRDPGAVSKQQFDSATAAQASNTAQVRQAIAKKKQFEADVETKKATAEAAKGDMLKASADVTKAETNLSYCSIVAPEDGRVTRKNVEPGSYTQAGEQLFAIVPNNVWVVANFKETQLAKMKIGDEVDVEIDAYPGMKLHGKVASFQYGTGSRFSVLPAENATGNFVKVVQRLPTKILLDNVPNDPDRPLALGMSAEPVVTLK